MMGPVVGVFCGRGGADDGWSHEEVWSFRMESM